MSRIQICFKEREQFLYEYAMDQLDSKYYIKQLIYNDMKKHEAIVDNKIKQDIVKDKNESDEFQIVFEG